MINKIIDGISKAIFAEFGAGYEIYTESIEQGLQQPCFSILPLNPTNELFFGKRYKRTNPFMIQFFPATDEPNQECHAVMERLFDCLETITVEHDQTRGTNMSGEIVDGVLHVQINFDMFVYKVETLDNKMDSYCVNADVRKGDANGS